MQISTGSVLVRNNVTARGVADGPPIVFAHGFGCDQGMWDGVAPAFEATHRVVLFDYVGAGSSEVASYDPQRYSSLEGYAQDVIEVCDSLELERVVFVGHSVSAMIGAIASLRRPELFVQLVMVAPSPCYIDDPGTGYVGGFRSSDIDELLDSLDANYFAWASATAPMVMGRPDEPELGERLERSFCRTDPDIARQFADVTFRSDCRDVIADVSVPSLLLQCRNDMLAPRDVGQYLHRHMADSTLVALDATGHCPHVSAPEEITDAIRTYLAGSP